MPIHGRYEAILQGFPRQHPAATMADKRKVKESAQQQQEQQQEQQQQEEQQQQRPGTRIELRDRRGIRMLWMALNSRARPEAEDFQVSGILPH